MRPGNNLIHHAPRVKCVLGIIRPCIAFSPVQRPTFTLSFIRLFPVFPSALELSCIPIVTQYISSNTTMQTVNFQTAE